MISGLSLYALYEMSFDASCLYYVVFAIYGALVRSMSI